MMGEISEKTRMGKRGGSGEEIVNEKIFDEGLEQNDSGLFQEY